MVFVSSSDTENVMLTTKSNLQFLCQNDVQIFGDGTFQYCALFWSVIYTSCLPKRIVCTMCVFPPSTQKQRMLYWNVSVSLGCLYSGKFRTQYYALESRFWISTSWSSKTLLAWCYYQGMSIPFGSSLVQKNTKSWINKWIQRSGISSRTVVENNFSVWAS